MLKENGDKISEEDKTRLNAEIEESKKVFAGDNLEEIKASLEKLTQVSNEVFSKLYQQSGTNPAGSTEGGTNGGSNDGDNINMDGSDYTTK